MTALQAYLDGCAPCVREALSCLSEGQTLWSTAASLLSGADRGSEALRLARALGFTGTDALGLPHPQADDENLPIETLIRHLHQLHPRGAGGLELALAAVGGRGPLGETGRRLWVHFGLDRDRVTRAADSVRAVSIAALRSAALPPAAEWVPHERADHGTFGPGDGMSVQASIGFHKLLTRAVSLMHMAGRDTITSLDLFRAALPHWSDPTIEQLVQGLGLSHDLLGNQLSHAAEPETLHLRIDTDIDVEYSVSKLAFRSFMMAGQIRDVDQVALTMTHLCLGMLLVPGTFLEGSSRQALGEGVNLPLLLLRLGRNRVSSEAAQLAIELGEVVGPGRVSPVSELPPRELLALSLDVHASEDYEFEAARRASSCVAGHHAVGTAEERREFLARFVGVGSFEALRSYLLCDPPPAAAAAARQLLAGTYEAEQAQALLDALDPQWRIHGELEPVLEPRHPDVIVRYITSVSLVSVQDDRGGDLRAAAHMAGSSAAEARIAAQAGDPRLTAIWTCHHARVAARVHRAAQGRLAGRAGTSLALVASDLDAAVGTVVSVLFDDERVLLARLGSDSAVLETPLSSATVRGWWRRYRLASLAEAPTAELLRELAGLVGLDWVLAGGVVQLPLRLALAGAFAGLPLGQAVASMPAFRGHPVVVHLTGGPFNDGFGGMRAPRGLLKGNVAVIAPPPLVGADDLPSAQIEAAAVARIHGARHTPGPDYLSRSHILRRMRLRSPALRPMVWHFATHGTMTPNAVGDITAGVLLLDHERVDTDEIGRYAAPEVLLCSACDIAALSPEAGAISWPGAAIAAGTQTVVAPCRPVNDHLTAATMLVAHRRWAAQDVPLWEAINAAQLAVDAGGSELLSALEELVPDAEHRERILCSCADAGEFGDHWAFMTYAP